MARHVRLALAALLVLCLGCRSYYDHYESGADRDIRSILTAKKPGAVDRIQADTIMPDPAGPAEHKPFDPDRVRTLSLPEALGLATERNRSFKSRIEDTQLSALSVSDQRRAFGPILTNSISYVFANSPSADASGDSSARIGVSQILPTGGTVSASTGAAAADNYESGASTVYTHDVTVSFEQPLLRGFGREPAFEALTQAERDAVYAIRDFELFRQDFSIETVRRYYSILRQKRVVENQRKNLEQFAFLRRRSDALFEIGRVTAADKFRAVQRELTAANTLITDQETLEALLNDFKIFLDLPTETPVKVEEVDPVMRPADIDLKSAIAAALHNRLELVTAAEQLEDAERGVRIARNSLLPDLDLATTVTVAGSKVGGTSTYGDGSHSASVELVLPLDKVRERNSYKRALIDRDRSRRAYSLAVQDVKVEVMDTYRRVRRLADSVRIERANVTVAEKRLENAKTRFEAGELGNRDVVEAQLDLLRAQNALVEAILDHEVSRLQLKRDIGILFIKPDGTWHE